MFYEVTEIVDGYRDECEQEENRVSVYGGVRTRGQGIWEHQNGELGIYQNSRVLLYRGMKVQT